MSVLAGAESVVVVRGRGGDEVVGDPVVAAVAVGVADLLLGPAETAATNDQDNYQHQDQHQDSEAANRNLDVRKRI